VYKSTALAQDLIKLKNKGYTVISTANSPKAISLQEFSFPKNSAVVIGSEGHGVAKEIFELSDRLLKIDINDEVTSLNASIAASIILFQLNSVSSSFNN